MNSINSRYKKEQHAIRTKIEIQWIIQFGRSNAWTRPRRFFSGKKTSTLILKNRIERIDERIDGAIWRGAINKHSIQFVYPFVCSGWLTQIECKFMRLRYGLSNIEILPIYYGDQWFRSARLFRKQINGQHAKLINSINSKNFKARLYLTLFREGTFYRAERSCQEVVWTKIAVHWPLHKLFKRWLI